MNDSLSFFPASFFRMGWFFSSVFLVMFPPGPLQPQPHDGVRYDWPDVARTHTMKPHGKMTFSFFWGLLMDKWTMCHGQVDVKNCPCYANRQSRHLRNSKQGKIPPSFLWTIYLPRRQKTKKMMYGLCFWLFTIKSVAAVAADRDSNFTSYILANYGSNWAFLFFLRLLLLTPWNHFKTFSPDF